MVRLRLDPNQVEEMRDYALRQGIETIRSRVDKLGVAEPTIIKKGTDIIVELPGLKPADFERIKKHHRPHRAARVQDCRRRRGVHEEGRGASVATQGRRADRHRRRHRGLDREGLGQAARGRLPHAPRARGRWRSSSPALTGDDRRAARSRDRLRGDAGRGEDGEATPDKYWRTYYLHKRAGAHRRVPRRTPTRPGTSRPGRPEVSFEFDHEGAAICRAGLTGENIGRKMAIILDEKINSAPVIEGRIGGARPHHAGRLRRPVRSSRRRPRTWSRVLRSGALPAPLQARPSRPRSARRWASDAVDKAKFSMSSAPLAVILFMLIYYRCRGLIANIAMVLNMLYMLAILAAFEASLTLPGIAGLVLTVGMAVDANIIIYERIREELRAGKSRAHAPSTPASRAPSGRCSTPT